MGPVFIGPGQGDIVPLNTVHTLPALLVLFPTTVPTQLLLVEGESGKTKVREVWHTSPAKFCGGVIGDSSSGSC